MKSMIVEEEEQLNQIKLGIIDGEFLVLPCWKRTQTLGKGLSLVLHTIDWGDRWLVEWL